VVLAAAGAGIVLCAVIGWVTATGTASGDVPLEVTARVLMVALPIGVGLYAWTQSASARFGRNLMLTGFVYFLAMLSSSGSEVVHSIGRVAAWAVEVWITYLLLSFPSGRLTTRPDRVIIALAAALAAVFFVPTALVVDAYPSPSQWASCVSDCPANAFQVTSNEPALIEAWVRPVREALTILVFVAVAVRLVMKLSAASPLLRISIGPVVVVAAARTVLYIPAFVLRAVDPEGTPAEVSVWLIGLFIPVITIAFLAGLLRWRLFVGASLGRLARHADLHTSPAALRDGLADAFRDPMLAIVDARPRGGWSDADGDIVAAPAAGSGRALTEVGENGRPVAAIIHDEALREERGFSDAATAHTLTMLENRRLAAQTEALLREVEDSRARIAATADEERRRLERDLHDGAQQRLVALRMRLSLAAELLAVDHARGAELVRQLGPEAEAAIEEMRALARGVYPAPLVDHGLAEALRAAARRSPLHVVVVAERGRRYTASIEAAAYFCCLEALQNAAKHADGATRVTVTIAELNGDLRLEVVDDGIGFDPARTTRGSGLTNLEDRARAIGGDAVVESSVGTGTRMIVSVPLSARE
jgi:signal transduction histidine kinase